MVRILAINPGATSTKLAVFDDAAVLFKTTVEHQGEELKPFKQVLHQLEYRFHLILSTLGLAHIPLESLDAVVGRGGLLKPMSGGTYAVNEAMMADLRAATRGEHASNLGGLLAHLIASQHGIPAFIVDPVSVDEMEPEARLSGLPDLPRASLSHALNSKAVARRTADEMGKPYESCRFVVAHLGTGVSVTPHREGRMIDVNGAQEEGPFSPDRCGGLPARLLARLCYSGNYTEPQMLERLLVAGGMYAYLGTRDVREAVQRAESGDEQADLVLKAMAYQVSKEIGAMAAVLEGEVDRIILTGGIAYSERIVADISRRVKFIAPIVVIPGEEELSSLAVGAVRVLKGEEQAKTY
ncbi:butyrate kinase [Holophaga foetida]|uniref:butyrate kinase n=1 Tax=Holophaga foetida TaxID=35839 RepID=UPI000247469F|nr:butyrate kinase [Holophaga foetida]